MIDTQLMIEMQGKTMNLPGTCDLWPMSSQIFRRFRDIRLRIRTGHLDNLPLGYSC